MTGPSVGDYVIGDDRALPSCDCSIARSRLLLDVRLRAGRRPASHWDATFSESVLAATSSGVLFPVQYSHPAGTKDWTLHIGDSFTDVPRSQPFYKKIETLLHNGITSGCSPTEYCPGQKISRGQIATFIAKGLAGSAANIPASGTVGDQPYDCTAGGASLFTDVDPTDMFCKQIHYIVSKNVDPGCDPGLYCPGDTLTRLQMAAFVANALVQPGGDAAVPVDLRTRPRHRALLQLRPGNPELPFHRRAGLRPSLQGRELPLGPGHHLRLLGDRVLPDGRSHARPDGQVPGQRVQVDAVRTVATEIDSPRGRKRPRRTRIGNPSCR